ncbi:MAG: hypothetical protein MUE45_05720 [Methanoregulaceae archaeon]|nr:hypothetical protein [Methanoregulaceae archaeon]MCU0628965.1 hypothetical protein [Methanoregulaceae archaeon]
MDEPKGSVVEPGLWGYYFIASSEEVNRGIIPYRVIPRKIQVMNISRREITVALAHRTKEVIMAQKALYAAATIHTTTLLMLLACIAVPLHAVCA